jgi:ketosteroid isomerase-like protein
MRWVLIPLAALALTACAPQTATVEAEVQQFVRAYVTSTDVTASVSMLDDGANVTSIGGEGRLLRGRDAIRDHANRHIALIRQRKISLGAIEVRPLGATHALVVAPFDATLNELPQLVLAEGALTLVLAKRDSGWKVVHEHYSHSSSRRP